jgi:hypothetical protein
MKKRPGQVGNCPNDAYDVWSVATHELGHVAGLDDLYTNEAKTHTMYGYIDKGETIKRDLHEHDKEGLRRIYPEPAPPTYLTAQGVSKSEIELYWGDNSYIENGFEIYRNNARITTVGANTEYYKDSGLSANTTYSYKVRAYRSKDNTTYYSIFSNTAEGTTHSDSGDSGDGGGGGCLAKMPSYMEMFPKDIKATMTLAYKKLIDSSSKDKNTVIGVFTVYNEEMDILLSQDIILREKFRQLINNLMPNINNIAIGKEESKVLTKEDINSFISYLDRLSERASLYFKRNIKKIKKVVSNSEGKSLKEVLLTRLPLPEKIKLLQNYPNPANPECYIPFELPEDAYVKIKIYTVIGQLVRTLDLGKLPAGEYITPEYAAYWDGKDNNQKEVAAGVYIYQLKVNDKVLTKKLVILK